MPPKVWLRLFLLAALPRVVLALLFFDEPVGLDDMFQYDMLARSLSSGKGYRWYQRADVAQHYRYFSKHYGIDMPIEQVPEDGFRTTFRAPGYPLFLASLYALADVDPRLGVARVAQALLGAALAPLTAALGLSLGLRQSAARWAGVALALYPTLWMYPLGLASENLFIPLLLIGLLAILQRESTAGALTAGVLLGFATLVRGALVLFLPLAAWWLYRRSGALRTFGFLGLALAVLLPWTIRNTLIAGKPTFVETTVGFNLYVGYHPEGDGSFKTELAFQPTRFINDQHRETWSTEQALEFIRQRPLRVVELSIKRLTYFWGLEDREIVYFYSNNYFGPLPPIVLILSYGLIVLPFTLITASAVLGFLICWQRSAGSALTSPHTLTLALVGATMLAYVPILAEPRFHLPLLPVLAVYAAASWAEVGLRARLAQMPRKLRTVGAVLLVGLAGAWIWEFTRDFDRLQQVLAPDGHRTFFGY